MKNLHTSLLGRTANINGDTTNRPYSIVAVWLPDGDRTLSVALEPINAFGRPTGGQIVTAFITDLLIA